MSKPCNPYHICAFSKSFSTSPIASKHHKILCRVLRPTWTDMGSNGRWEPQKKVRDLYDYTTDPILMPRNGGRGPNGKKRFPSNVVEHL